MPPLDNKAVKSWALVGAPLPTALRHSYAFEGHAAFYDEDKRARLLARCYEQILWEASAQHAQTLALPVLGLGPFCEDGGANLDVRRPALVALRTVLANWLHAARDVGVTSLQRITICAP